jgi:hypothetical protein
MIRDHEFNTRWWGKTIGIVQDPAFFSLDATVQNKLLKPYAWAEFYARLDQAPPRQKLAAAGFFQTDRWRLHPVQTGWIIISLIRKYSRFPVMSLLLLNTNDFNIFRVALRPASINATPRGPINSYMNMLTPACGYF